MALIIPLAIIGIAGFTIIVSSVLYLKHYQKLLLFIILWNIITIIMIVKWEFLYANLILKIGLMRVFDVFIIWGFFFIIVLLLFAIRIIGDLQNGERIIIQNEALKKEK